MATIPNVPRLRLHITAAAESILRQGHPWLFSDSIQDQNRDGALGEIAAVYDHKDRLLALGLFDPDSPIRLRVLHVGKPVVINKAFWAVRLQHALDRRRGHLDLQTTGYRWINGESDHWPGLVLDRYDRTLVMKLYTGAWLPRLDEITAILQEHLKPERIVLRLSRNIQELVKERSGREDGIIVRGPPLEGPVIFKETGLQFEADVLKGQKTGFFLDQRENRRRVESLAKGQDVLNAFSFSGGFSLYAARGGARSVTDLDISAHALRASNRNFALNEALPAVAGCRHQTVQCDVFDWLRGNTQQKFWLIILDPPSLAKRDAEKGEALRAYGRLASSALKHLLPGGVLLACSCSAHVTRDEFFAVVQQAASNSRRKFTQIETTGHAPDHPATFKEAEYLKAIYLRL